VTRSRGPRSRAGAPKRRVKAGRAHPQGAGPGAHRWLVCAVVVLTTALLGWAESIVWIGAIVREFGALIGTVALLLGAGAVVSRRALPAGLLLTASLIAWFPSWPLIRAVRLSPEKGPVLHVAEASLDGTEVAEKRVRSLAQSAQIDLVAIVGATDRSLHVLDAALPHMPHRARHLGTDRRQAVWSRLPLRGVSGAPLMRVRVGKCDVQVVIPSLAPLTAAARKAERARELHALEAIADSARAVWLGALGSRPQAADLSRLMAKQRLRDSRLGHGLLATTPGYLGPLGQATDHVLVRGWIAVRERRVHEPLGDGAHATLTSTLELTDPRCR